MAQINHYRYDRVLAGSGLPPGGEESWAFGPYGGGLREFGTFVTAHPTPGHYNYGTSHQLRVTNITSTIISPVTRFLGATIRNVGPSPVRGYTVWLTEVRP